jgi:CotH kinase protein/Chitobiase/beta-hexosaminidase C-terminal domain/Lectin C-type domain/HYR domain/Secretion system C-terminal sorting domain/Divergent InlB B-repeat domain
MMMKRRTPFVTHFVALVTLLFSQFVAHAQVTQPPVASIKGGRFTTPIRISLTSATPDAVIRFTLDGSEPTDTSDIYVAPILLNASMPLRAKAFGIAPLTPSQIVTHTYLFNVSHTFPIVALSFHNSAFFNADTGMYVQYLQKREVIANIEFFEPNVDTALFSKLVGTEITGSTSAALPQKSLEIKSKPALGTPTIPYKLFSDLPYNDYKRFVLRNSGNEWGVTMFRDAMVSGLFRDINDISDVLQQPATFMQGYRPAVVYFNGQYWGIHNVRERMKSTYIDQHFGLSSTAALTNYDLSENDGSLFEQITGDSIAWYQFVADMRRTSRRFDTDSAFAWMSQRIDIDNFTDYILLNVFADNTDWPTNNVRRFRERRVDGKWRWICYDFDFSFGLLTSGGFNTNDATQNALQRVLNPPFPGVSTSEILQRCFQNAKFRQKFANRMADFLNTAFTPARVQGRIAGFKNLYAPEIDKHRVRWGTPFQPQWLNNIQKITDFAGNRAEFTYSHFRLQMPELTDTTLVTLNVSPANAGTLKFNTLMLNQNRLPYVGKYFSGIPIPVKAIAAAGFRFAGWSNSGLGTNDSVQVTFAGGVQSLTALFLPIGTCGAPDTFRLTSTTCVPSAAGLFTTRFTNRFGCDSIVIKTINLNPSDTIRLLGTTCVLANVGTFTTRLVNRFGCDSIIIRTISFNPSDTTRLTGTTCVLANVGTFTTRLVNRFGCDSIVITTVSINPSDTTRLTGTTCILTNVGTFTTLLVNRFGCDSIIIRTISFNSSDTTRLTGTTCVLANVGTFTTQLLNRFGCDSIVIRTISFNPSDTTRLTGTTCVLANAGTFTTQLLNRFGCDSIIIRTISFNQSDTTRLTGTTCVLANVGTFTTQLVNRFGCDSIVIRTISFNSSDTTRLSETTCVLANIGTFTTRLINRFGCDSIVITTRTFQALPKPIVTKNNNVLTSTISTSYQWFFNNIQLSGSVGQNHIAANTGYYQVQITNAQGCIAKSDSMLVTIAPVFNCPAISKNFGDPCNDGNPATTNDRVQTDCSCRGTLAISITCSPNLNLTVSSTANNGVVNWAKPAATSTCTATCTAPAIAGFRFVGKLGKKLYYYSNGTNTWANARTACANAGGKLAIITDANQNNALKNWIGSTATAWIGLSAPVSGGNYQWIDGTTLSFTNWATGEPTSGQLARRDFVSLNGSSARWETSSSTRSRNFLMEKVCGDTAAIAQTTGLISGSTFPVGTTLITYKATDACGNQTTCSFNVNVIRAAFCNAPTNVAIGKTARQSSNFTTAYTASRAIDNNTSGTPSRTNRDSNAWWEIDLGVQHNITELKLWNKTDVNLVTPSNYYVFISQNPFVSTSVNTTLTQAGVSVFSQTAGMARPTTIPVTKKGRYVRIQLRQRNYLNMSEVQIMGCVTPTISNIPTAGLRKQSDISSETDNEFSLYPNPTSGDLNLNLQSFEHADTEFYIHNGTGAMILHQSLKDTPIEWSLKLGDMNLPSGIYTATIVYEGHVYSKRFVLIGSN